MDLKGFKIWFKIVFIQKLFMNDQAIKGVSVLLFLGIVLLIGFNLTFAESFKFNFEEDNVLFSSNVDEPLNYLQSLREKEEFLVVTSLSEEPSEMNAAMAQGLNVFSVVLVIYEKKVVSLARVFDSSNNLIYCYTNNGDNKVNEKISAEECSGVQRELGSKVLIELNSFDSKLGKSRVVLKQNQIKIYPSTVSEIHRVSFLTASGMFEGVREIIEVINYLASKVSSASSVSSE